jgi:hypothetical protein
MAHSSFREHLEKLNTIGYTRRVRRLMIGLSTFTCAVFYFNAVMDLSFSRSMGRFYGIASCISALTALGSALFWTRFLRQAAFSMSREERAQMEFGKPYSQLSKMHQFDVGVRVGREIRSGTRPSDERETAMQREAERRAFRLLRIALPIFVLAYWAVCLSLPAGPTRVGLLIGAVVLSGMAIPVMSLPDLIRLWTQPDDVGEPHVMAIEPTPQRNPLPPV